MMASVEARCRCGHAPSVHRGGRFCRSTILTNNGHGGLRRIEACPCPRFVPSDYPCIVQCPTCAASVLASRGRYFDGTAVGCAFDEHGNGLAVELTDHAHQPGQSIAPFNCDAPE